MNDEKPVDLVVCPECGAAMPPTDARCWMCGRANVPGKWSDRHPASRPSGQDVAVIITVATVLVALAAVAMFSGLVSEAPGLAVLFLVVITPGLLATWIASQQATKKGQPMTWQAKLARFLVSTVIIFGMLAVLWISAVVALFVLCLFLISGSQMKFN